MDIYKINLDITGCITCYKSDPNNNKHEGKPKKEGGSQVNIQNQTVRKKFSRREVAQDVSQRTDACATTGGLRWDCSGTRWKLLALDALNASSF